MDGEAVMPVYTYKCDICGIFDYRQGMGDANLEHCPTCQSKVWKTFSVVNVSFVGDGFYSNDKRKGNKK